MSKLDKAIYPLLPNSQWLDSDEAIEVKNNIKSLMLELLADTMAQARNVEDIGQLFADKVKEL